MIYVTQGHEKGVGVELFLKSFFCLTSHYQKQFVFFCDKNTLQEHVEIFNLNLQIEDHFLVGDNYHLELRFLNNKNLTQTIDSLISAMKALTANDVLLTLPSSKDQFLFNGKSFNGHTEFFRDYYNKQDIGMCFLAPDTNVLLLTDHISIDKVQKSLSKVNIIEKVRGTLESLTNIRPITEVYFSGINPHSGEDGLISNFDIIIDSVVEDLRLKFPGIKFHDKMPGDTIHFNMKNRKQLFIYAFHDQGLAPFKLKYGLSGINFTTNMNYKRVSVDHGTSFNLFGTGTASYSGLLYLLEEIKTWQK